MSEAADDDSLSHREWVKGVGEVRQAVRESLIKTSTEGVDPERVTPPTDGAKRDAVTDLHAYVLDYREQLRPWGGQVPEKWTETLHTAHVPQIGSHDEQFVDVSLNSLDEWRLQEAKVTRQVDHHVRGTQEKTAKVRVRLPPAACAAANQQLDAILEQLGLAADVDPQEQSEWEV
jgi:hypothetical protein